MTDEGGPLCNTTFNEDWSYEAQRTECPAPEQPVKEAFEAVLVSTAIVGSIGAFAYLLPAIRAFCWIKTRTRRRGTQVQQVSPAIEPEAGDTQPGPPVASWERNRTKALSGDQAVPRWVIWLWFSSS